MDIKITCTQQEFGTLVRDCKAASDAGFCSWCIFDDVCPERSGIENAVDVVLVDGDSDG